MSQTDWRAAYKGLSWTGPECIGGRRLHIEAARQGLFEGKSTNILTARSGEERKEWIICKTNGACLACMFGPVIEDWIGKAVDVYFDPSVRMGPAEVGGIRIKGSPQLQREVRVTVTLAKRKPTTYTLSPSGTSSEAPSVALSELGVTWAALDAVTAAGRPVPSTLTGSRQAQYLVWLRSAAGADILDAARAHLTTTPPAQE